MAAGKSSELIWEVDLPLFSRRMLGSWTWAMCLVGLLMCGLLGVVFVAQGEWRSARTMLGLFAAITAAMWLLGILIMAVLFRGKFPVRYTLSASGIRCDVTSRTAKVTNRLAIAAGILGRSPQTLGAGLLATSRESEAALWTGAFRADPHPASHRIELRNAWRSLLWVQCRPDNYVDVAAAIDAHMARHQTASRVSSRSPLPAYLGRTLFVVVANAPLFVLADEFRVSLFLPIFTLCFALATVWLINIFGWVVIGGLVVMAAEVVLGQMEVRESMFEPGRVYRAWEVLGGDDISLLVISGAGALALGWMSWRAVRGRWMAALVQGFEDMSG
ncbi:MAG: hypothetical protein KAY59_05070 [Acidobacteria bacterium]|nr:hypothetical protein [Acidobacteriota bacterium]